MNPDNCVLCNNGLRYLETIDCDTFQVIFPTRFSKEESLKYLKETPAFRDKHVLLEISDNQVSHVRNTLEIPELIQSLIFIYGANNKIVRYYDFRQLSYSSVRAINALIKVNIKISEKKVNDPRFSTLGYEDICSLSGNLVCLSYPQNKIMVVDSYYNLIHILLPSHLPIIQLYSVYNNNDTTGFSEYFTKISTLNERGKTPIFQFNSIKPFTDSTFLIMGSLYVATSGLYQGQPSTRISQELMLIEFMDNKILSIHSLRSDKQGQIKRGFYLDYTNYTKSFDGKGIDVAIERDDNRGKKYFLAKLSSDQGQTSLASVYKLELPELIKKDTTPYMLYTFYKEDNHVFFKYEFSTVYMYNESKLINLKIKGMDKLLRNSLQSSYALECVSRQPFGYELLMIDSAFKRCVIVRLDNDLTYISSITSNLLCSSKSNVVYDYHLNSYVFRSNDNVINILSVE